MATVRQPISRLPLVEDIDVTALVPMLENPEDEVNRRTVAASIETITGAIAQAVLFEVLVRVALFINNEPDHGEMVLRYIFPESVAFPPGLTESLASSVIAATGISVFSFQKNDVEFGTVTFGAGQSTGVFAGAGATLNSNDVLTFISPNPKDATLSGISITLAGGRV